MVDSYTEGLKKKHKTVKIGRWVLNWVGMGTLPGTILNLLNQLMHLTWTCRHVHSVTDPSHKEYIIQAFTKWSHLRLVIATIAFGMGVDCPNIQHVAHDNIES